MHTQIFRFAQNDKIQDGETTQAAHLALTPKPEGLITPFNSFNSSEVNLYT